MGEAKRAVAVGVIQQRIFLIRGVKVIVDADLAAFYGVSAKRLHEQVRRNADRFPADFMFRLNREEKDELVAKCGHLSGLKHSTALPRVFTEHRELAKRVAALETHLAHHDEHILALFSAIKELMSPEELPEPRRIGFRTNGD